MDGRRRFRGRRGREDRTPPPPPPPPAPHNPGEPMPYLNLFRDVMTMMQEQHRQTQEMLIQQQQQFLQQFAPRQDAGPAHVIPAPREVRFTEFVKLAPSFDGKISDPVSAENWVAEMEKDFAVCEVPNDGKLALIEYQLKDDAYRW